MHKEVLSVSLLLIQHLVEDLVMSCEGGKREVNEPGDGSKRGSVRTARRKRPRCLDCLTLCRAAAAGVEITQRDKCSESCFCRLCVRTSTYHSVISFAVSLVGTKNTYSELQRQIESNLHMWIFFFDHITFFTQLNVKVYFLRKKNPLTQSRARLSLLLHRRWLAVHQSFHSSLHTPAN